MVHDANKIPPARSPGADVTFHWAYCASSMALLMTFDTSLAWSNLNYPNALAPALVKGCAFFTKILAYCVAPPRSPRVGA